MKRTLITLLALCFIIPPPAQAVFDIGDVFGYGYIKSLGQGTSYLVAPTFSLATAAVIIYFLIGAFKFLTSAGDKEAVASARNMITHAIIGFVILIFAYLILQFIPQFFKIQFLIF